MNPVEPPLSPDACYLALKAKDARFDGSFFTGVTSTGIYCRPVCRVRTPRRENCRFFAHAAQAESAGFRPCLRCRPELAPQALRWSVQDASAMLAQQAARLLDEPEAWGGDAPSVDLLAQRLGISGRHLRRIFEMQLGVSPLQYLQTRRLLSAKQLLADTGLPITQVALISGFGSVRRFNAAFTAHYGLSPGALRREGAQHDAFAQVRLGYRPPYDVDAMLGFFRTRAIEGLEVVGERTMSRTLALDANGRRWEGWLARCCCA
jgi:AraC family transcriptional regulator, regulatory protein of adaptative response / DNA-3-methyladenine glycosylase II